MNTLYEDRIEKQCNQRIQRTLTQPKTSLNRLWTICMWPILRLGLWSQLTEEFKIMDSECNSTHQKVFECLEQLYYNQHSASMKSDFGKDLWKQMKHVSIPVYDGSKRNYESWKATFMACVDITATTPE